jgi:hypothetical protein
VTRRWLNFEGVAVAQHVAQSFAAMEAKRQELVGEQQQQQQQPAGSSSAGRGSPGPLDASGGGAGAERQGQVGGPQRPLSPVSAARAAGSSAAAQQQGEARHVTVVRAVVGPGAGGLEGGDLQPVLVDEERQQQGQGQS